MTPRVSAVLPTYNRAEKVQGAIDSVLAQTFADVEIVVVDDGSSDGTGDVLRAKYGDRIHYIAQRNQGVSGARNTGIGEARGEWIAFLDSDDRWERDKLECQFEAIDQLGPRCGACYTDVRFFNHSEIRTMFELARGEYQHTGPMGVNTDVLRLLVRPGGPGMVVCPSSFLARADLIRKTGGLNTRLRFQQDTEFMFRLALLTNFCYVNRPLVGFDRSPVEIRHAGQVVPGVSREGAITEWDRVEFVLQDSQVWLDGLLQLNDVPQKVQALIRDQLGLVYSGLANCYLIRGQYADARDALSTAIKLNPSFNLMVKWLLARVSPGLALRAVLRHQERTKDSGAFV